MLAALGMDASVETPVCSKSNGSRSSFGIIIPSKLSSVRPASTAAPQQVVSRMTEEPAMVPTPTAICSLDSGVVMSPASITTTAFGTDSRIGSTTFLPMALPLNQLFPAYCMSMPLLQRM
eukprot:CAMPEP_0202338590 /NCGR_PEP_ID=MMETSP1126-20121109/806_1 /ASSEMBLY_ACC=CAM_ASM_000457 /TAXON_ID=3047 /ORGANISM="Dunaliella tertiolecta, Strain CCMP1320" /LENGTH=119 /DNA_ID=CAMNT_0048929001 /DNA_START=287 /DNA_END=646 /DNA_ORIENTATION=-